MSEPFPSPEYIKLCTQPEVAEKLREEWEPKPYDLVWMNSELGIVTRAWPPGEPEETWFTALFLEGGRQEVVRCMAKDALPPIIIPLFTLRQLVGLLEERGIDWELVRWEDEYQVAIFKGRPVSRGSLADGVYCGPDPESAMLRAWLEVAKEERCPKRS